jgi:hypothetical protein
MGISDRSLSEEDEPSEMPAIMKRDPFIEAVKSP